jgi:tol-pal system protein YbgF
MNSKKIVAFIAVVAMAIGPVTPAFAVSKEIVQLQTQVQALADQMARMQQSFDERMGVMRNLVEQSTDSVNKLAISVDQVQKGLSQQTNDTAGKVDQVSGQVQALHDSLDELKARMAKVSKQLEDMQAQQSNLNAGQAAPGMPGQPGGAPQAQQQAPPADVLYNNALRDYNAAKYDLAAGEFADYLKFYSNTELAGNAQFYLADIEYRQGNFEQAVKDYDKVIEQYPGGNKGSAAQLKKGYALLELGRQQEGIRELNALVARYPRSQEAAQARDRLKKLGASSSAKPTATKRTR